MTTTQGTLGDQLVELVGSVRQECLLVAPYIKRATLSRILTPCSHQARLRVVTRWRIDEIALGVSDLEVWDLLKERDGAELWLQPSLHAKYFRGDERVILGSANLTHSGLGWAKNSNLELLEEVFSPYHGKNTFETALFRNATRVDDGLYQEFVEALAAFSSARPPLVEIETGTQLADWRPELRFPSDFYLFYSNDFSVLSAAACEAAANDLAALRPPAGMNNDQFVRWIGLALLQSPEFQAIYRFVTVSRRFGEMGRLLEELGATNGSRAWQTWMRWILHFLPDKMQFHTANYSEIVSRK